MRRAVLGSWCLFVALLGCREKMKVNLYEADLGVLTEKTIEARVDIPKKVAQKIERIKTSCGCLEARVESKSGRYGIQAQLAVKQQGGVYNQQVYLFGKMGELVGQCVFRYEVPQCFTILVPERLISFGREEEEKTVRVLMDESAEVHLKRGWAEKTSNGKKEVSIPVSLSLEKTRQWTKEIEIDFKWNGYDFSRKVTAILERESRFVVEPSFGLMNEEGTVELEISISEGSTQDLQVFVNDLIAERVGEKTYQVKNFQQGMNEVEILAKNLKERRRYFVIQKKAAEVTPLGTKP